MGGKEGGRGYLYQGIVAVLEALRRNDWDRIYIEFPTEGDKVDFADRRLCGRGTVLPDIRLSEGPGL